MGVCLQYNIFHPYPFCVIMALLYLLVLTSSSESVLFPIITFPLPRRLLLCSGRLDLVEEWECLGVSVQPGTNLCSRPPNVCIKYTFPHSSTLAGCHPHQYLSLPSLENIWPVGMRLRVPKPLSPLSSLS